MTEYWHFDPAEDWSRIDIYDHTQSAGDDPVLTVDNPDSPGRQLDAQGIPTEPDIRDAIYQHLWERGEVDLDALIGIIALTGTGLERGTPP